MHALTYTLSILFKPDHPPSVLDNSAYLLSSIKAFSGEHTFPIVRCLIEDFGFIHFDSTQFPSLHIKPEPQTFPQLPQLLLSVNKLISQTSDGFSLQFAFPVEQVKQEVPEQYFVFPQFSVVCHPLPSDLHVCKIFPEHFFSPGMHVAVLQLLVIKSQPRLPHSSCFFFSRVEKQLLPEQPLFK